MLALLALLSCDDPAGPGVYHTSCDDAPGVTHSGAQGNARWRSAEGPHRLSGTVTFETLEIEAGTLVCGGPGAVLGGDSLTAIGTPDAPIVFAAEDPAAPWAGMELWNHGTSAERNPNRLHHVVVRDLLGGIEARDLDLRHARVERACQGGSDCTAVRGTGYSAISLQDVVIDRSGGMGVSSGWRAGVALTRVRIQNSAGVGLVVSAGDGGGTNSIALRVDGLRIVGGASHPASIGAWHLEEVAGTREAVDSLGDNVSDTLLVAVVYDSLTTPMTVYRDLHWRLFYGAINGNPSRLIAPDLTIEAGASVSFEHREMVLRARRLNALGTAEHPVVLSGGHLSLGAPDSDAATDTARLTHTRLVLMGVAPSWGGGPVSVAIDGLRASRSSLHLRGRSRVRDALFDSSRVLVSGDAVFEDVDFMRSGYFFGGSPVDEPAPALAVSSGSLAISGCDIRAGSGDALRVDTAAAAGSSITGCNLVSNGGFGVNNLSAFAVDAGGNWWGDPAGPDGPNGDGVSGDVVVEPVLTEPVQR